MADHTPSSTTEDSTDAPDDGRARSRRQMLTLAGAAAVGGAALTIANASPAGAGNGDPILIGQNNTGTGGTQLSASGGIAVFNAQATADGVHALSAQSQDTADIKLTGTGRLGQAASAPTNGSAPSFSNVIYEEIARSSNGIIWATAASGWKRINSLRVDNPNGNGSAFSPFRLLDTRDGSGAITFSGKRNYNSTTHLDVGGLSQIPDDAVAVFGNITTVQPSPGGFITLWPRGVAKPTVSAVNFGSGDIVNNAFIVGLGTGSNAGQFSMQPGSTPGGTVHVVIDINGYIQ